MDRFSKKACEEIDAGMLSADAFHDHESPEELERDINRWKDEMADITKMLSDK